MSNNIISKIDLVSMSKTSAPALDFVLPGLLRGTVGLITGPGGVGKSFLTFQLALSVASGHNFNVHSGYDNQQTIPRRVLWLTAEDSQEILHHRLHSILNLNKTDDQSQTAHFQAQIEAALSYISLIPTIGTDFSLVNFDGESTEKMQDLHKIIQKEKPELIFIDTLRRFHDSDENDNGKMSMVIRHFESIAKSYNCAAVLIHHENKSGLNNSDASQGAVRGASAIIDNARWLVRLRSMSSDESKRYFNDENHERRRELVCLEAGVKSNYSANNGGLWFKKSAGGALEQTTIEKQTTKLSVINNDKI